MNKVKQIIITGTLLVSVATFAQKDELKALKKIYAKEIPTAADIVDYKANVSKLEPIATEEADKVYAGFYKAMLPIMEMIAIGPNITPVQIMKLVNQKSISDLEKGLNATLDYEKKTGKKVYTDDILETITSYKPQLIGYADALGQERKFKEASEVLYSIYLMDKKDLEMLYYTASYAFNAQDFDTALKYYQQLKAVNYSGEGIMYYATDKASKKEEYFGTTPAQRDLMVKTGQFEKPRSEKIPSKRGEIYKNIALILVDKGQTEEAKTALADARKLNPDDTSLIVTEADIYYKLKDMESYKRLVNEALQKNPNDKDLIFNLGVVASNADNIPEAEAYYKKVLELDPNYVNAYLNLAELTLRADDKFVNDMNKLGTSDKEIKQYDVIKLQRDNNFKKVVPLLEKALELKPDDAVIKKSLNSVYNALDMKEKAKTLKAKM